MPIPCAVIPFIPFIASMTTAGTTTLSTGTLIAGAVLGGTAGASGAWWWFSPPPGPTREHLELLEAQRVIITSRIESANAVVQSLCRDSRALGLAVEAAAASTNVCSEHLQQLVDSVAVTHQRLTEALKVAYESSHALTDAMPELKAISNQVLEQGEDAIKSIDLLNATLDSKTASLISIAADIKALNEVVDEQSRLIMQLKDASHVQDTTINYLTSQVQDLEGIATRYSNNCNFFKQVALQTLTTQSNQRSSLTNQARGIVL